MRRCDEWSVCDFAIVLNSFYPRVIENFQVGIRQDEIVTKGIVNLPEGLHVMVCSIFNEGNIYKMIVSYRTAKNGAGYALVKHHEIRFLERIKI